MVLRHLSTPINNLCSKVVHSTRYCVKRVNKWGRSEKNVKKVIHIKSKDLLASFV